MTATPHTTYDDFFRSAFPGRTPIGYQWRLAATYPLSSLVNAVPGAGKTAASIGTEGSGI